MRTSWAARPASHEQVARGSDAPAIRGGDGGVVLAGRFVNGVGQQGIRENTGGFSSKKKRPRCYTGIGSQRQVYHSPLEPPPRPH